MPLPELRPRFLVFCASALFATAACAQAPGPNLDEVRVVQRLGSRVPMTAVFKDRFGRQIQFRDCLKTRPALVLPIFYKC